GHLDRDLRQLQDAVEVLLRLLGLLLVAVVDGDGAGRRGAEELRDLLLLRARAGGLLVVDLLGLLLELLGRLTRLVAGLGLLALDRDARVVEQPLGARLAPQDLADAGLGDDATVEAAVLAVDLEVLLG